MLRFFATLLFALLVGIGQSEDLESRCSAHCLSKMGLVTDFVAANQDRWNSCKAIEANGTKSLVGCQIEVLQEAVTSIQTSQESKDGWMETIEAQMELMMRLLETMDSEITKIVETVPKLDRMSVPPWFELIGTRFFYIENSKELVWSASEMECRKLGGYLASIKNREELALIGAQVKENTTYWLGNYDPLGYQYVSVASGQEISFMDSGGHLPHPEDDSQMQCFCLSAGHMYVKSCSKHSYNFICQAGDES